VQLLVLVLALQFAFNELNDDDEMKSGIYHFNSKLRKYPYMNPSHCMNNNNGNIQCACTQYFITQDT